MTANYPQAAHSVEANINRIIDDLIALLNLRRAQLLAEVRDACEEKRAAEVARQEIETQLITAQTALQTHLKANSLKPMQERMVSEMEQKLREFRMNIPAETQMKWQCDTRNLEVSISSLGEIVHAQLYQLNYVTLGQNQAVPTYKRMCPFCKELNSIDARACSSCGRNFLPIT